MPESLYTPSKPFRRVLTTNGTASAFAAVADTLSVPSGAGYVALPPGNAALVRFFGTDAADETGSCRIYGVKAIEGSGATSYTHTLLGEYGFTLSTLTGVSGGVVTNSEFYADTITRVAGVENVSDQIVSPTSDEPAHLLLDRKGHDLLFFEPIVVTAASVNALIAGV